MSVGIHDVDLYTYTQIPLNLEVMKLAAYYKKQREIVVLSPAILPDRHTKFFIIKDYDDDVRIKNIAQYDNVECKGLYFSSGRYIPLPIEIEKMKPDTSIYSKAEILYKNKNMPFACKLFKTMMRAEHCRFSLDEHTLWSEYERQFKSLSSARVLMIHDRNLANIEGAFEEIQKIVKAYPRIRIATKFPIVVHKEEDFLKWASLPAALNLFQLEFHGILTPPAFMQYIKYSNGGFIEQTDFYISEVPRKWLTGDGARQLLRQALICRIRNKYFALRGIDEILIEEEWKNYFKLLNNFSLAKQTLSKETLILVAPRITLQEYIKWLSKTQFTPFNSNCIDLDQAQRLKEFIRERNPELYRDFFNCNFNTIIEEGEYVE